ncbi:hypothetical protein PCANC_23429 [Puccinia coronata f. sp. avenae]|uniref:F-box domain-containing protein n=1 Tax=Puccinia coronata f. sp. avenae TaxID=200324 RepID=A0A2N5SGI3_9BASI|nr:hypothetical protein PCANC_23429 [Puccinia coronata f. sp. avenae]
MRSLVDLPWNVVEIIFNHAEKDSNFLWRMLTGGTDHGPGKRTVIGTLRLVCRKWADWLYAHYLYRTMVFNDASRAADFIAEINNRSKQLPRARCQTIQILGILTHGSAPDPRAQGQPFMILKKHKKPMTSDILKSLIDLFSDTIVELNLQFWNVLSLPTQVIETIGRIENLHVLRLGHELQDTVDMFANNFDDESPPTDMDPVKSKIDHDCLKSLIQASRNLESLDLTDLDPICLPKATKSDFSDHQIPTVTQLEISLDGQTASRLLDLSVLLKPTLKVLSLQDRWNWAEDHGSKLVPVFENIRERLEGLFLTDDSFLTPINKLEFPKLRVFKTVFWRGSVAELVENPILSSSPIEVLALHSERINSADKKNLRFNPFSSLPMLRRLVICEARPDYVLSPAYQDACKSQKVVPAYLSIEDSSNVSLIMRL